jgi:hypothetical protein
VRDRFQWYADWAAAAAVAHKLSPTMFCTPEKSALPLERCMRFLPHHNDTGGFFVAVLEKVAPLPPLPDPDAGHRLRPLGAGAAGGEGAEAAAVEGLRAAAAAAAAYALKARRAGWGGRGCGLVAGGASGAPGRSWPS